MAHDDNGDPASRPDRRADPGGSRDDATAEEYERIRLLVARDGHPAARAWVERTLRIYLEAVASPGSHASLPHYRPLFEASIEVFRQWLRDQPPRSAADE